MDIPIISYDITLNGSSFGYIFWLYLWLFRFIIPLRDFVNKFEVITFSGTFWYIEWNCCVYGTFDMGHFFLQSIIDTIWLLQ